LCGLLAIGAWATYSDVQGKVDHEATALGALYRDIGAYTEPARTILEQDLRTYTRQIIDVGWPMQRRGIVSNNASPVLNDFQQHFMSYEPQDERQKILAAEAYRDFNDLTESRRARLNSVTSEMPGPLWTLVIVGAGICIAVTWFLHPESFAMHFWTTILFSGLLALLIFLIAVLDNPIGERPAFLLNLWSASMNKSCYHQNEAEPERSFKALFSRGVTIHSRVEPAS
jgi:Protein of unknown function (DUF4239)